jgi:threonine dehydratase
MVMSTKASTSKVAATNSYGDKVILEGEYHDESFLPSKEIAKDEKSIPDLCL